MNSTPRTEKMLRIRSLNCHRSYEVLYSLLNHSDPLLFDILCIQEPPLKLERPLLSPFKWNRVLPAPSEGGAAIKSLIYVSHLFSSQFYTQIPLPHTNITGLRLDLNSTPISLFNVYNPPNCSQTIEILAEFVVSSNGPLSDSYLLVGDFNKHDSLWAGPLHSERSSRSKADSLVDLIIRLGLELCFEPGTPTFFSAAHRTWSTLDLCLASADSLMPLLNHCVTFSGDASDHLGLDIEFAIPLTPNPQPPRPRYRETDWASFGKKMAEQFAGQAWGETPIDTPADLDRMVSQVEASMMALLKEMVPISKESSYKNRWWTAELSSLRKAYRRTQRQATKHLRSDTSWDQMKEARNAYLSAIRTQKRRHWRQFIEELTPTQLWTAVKYTDDTPRSTARVPALEGPRGLVSDTQGKSDLLFNTFFPSPPESYSPPTPPTLPALTLQLPDFNLQDIQRAIDRLSPYKAPGPSGEG